jgi:hypothetical protein
VEGEDRDPKKEKEGISRRRKEGSNRRKKEGSNRKRRKDPIRGEGRIH